MSGQSKSYESNSAILACVEFTYNQHGSRNKKPRTFKL